MLVPKQTVIALALLMPAAIVLGIVAVIVAGTSTAQFKDFFPLLAIGVGGPIIIAVLWIIYAAATGQPWAVQIYLGIMVFIVDALFRKHDADALGLDWQSLLKFSIALAALIIGIAHWQRISSLLLRPPVVWMLLYALWAIFSSVYSVTPVYTFAAGIMFLSFVLFAAVVTTTLTLRQTLTGLIVSWSIFLILSWIVYFLLPDLGRAPFGNPSNPVMRFSGLGGLPNTMGRILALMFVTLTLLYSYRFIQRPVLVVLLPIIVVTFFLTQSRTAFLSAILASALILMRRQPALIWLSLITITALMFFLEMAQFQMHTAIFSRSGDVSELYTLTGRTDIWAFLWDAIIDEPWFGSGYAGSRLVISGGWANEYGWTTISSHNMWLQSLLTVGLIGTIPLILAVAKQIVDFFRDPNPMRDAVLVFVLITGMLEAGAIGPVPNVLTLFWLIAMSSALASKNSTCYLSAFR